MMPNDAMEMWRTDVKTWVLHDLCSQRIPISAKYSVIALE